jgi:Zn-dependent M28 family amino/carboxypeptidase
MPTSSAVRRRLIGRAVLLAAVVVAPVIAAPVPPKPNLSAARIRAHVEFLADDALEGREAGTRGYDLAAHYVATQMAQYGLEPAADDGSWFQKVPLRRSSLINSGLHVTAPGVPEMDVAIPDEGIVAPNSRNPDLSLTAGVVFAGFGVTAPDLGYDDYKGLDVNGKFALILYNAPSSFPSEMRAHYSSQPQKFRMAADHGAVGVIVMFRPDDAKTMWERLKGYATQPAVTTLLPDGTPVMAEPRLQAVSYVSEAGARKVLAGSSVTFEQAVEHAGDGKTGGAALASTVTLTVKSRYEEAQSENVVGKLKGSVPALASTSVVLTAHLDHLGIKPSGEGDRINNGAYDNATGSAILLEVARAFAEAPTRPKRSVVVVFLTAEEKGLLGSDYFARYPAKAAGRVIADVNLDMPVFMTASKDIVAFGAENSTLDAVVKRAIAAEGYTLSPDPMPEQNIFVRSDQYSFVKRGIPSVYLEPGFTAADPKVNGREVFESFLNGHYHQPSDDLSLPMDLTAVARFADANYLIAREIADDPVAPSWKPGNFFGKVYGSR